MQKAVKRIYLTVLIFSVAVFVLMGYADLSIPDEIFLTNKNDISSNAIFTFRISDGVKQKKTENVTQTGNYEMNVKLFDTIPVKTAKVTFSKRKYVTLGGSIFGIRMYTDGVMIVSNQEIETDNGSISPGEKAGLKSGDIILKINGRKIVSSANVSEIIKDSGGKEIEITAKRNEQEFKVVLEPVKSKEDGKFKAGLWVRDSTAGIGTMTFFDRDTGIFAGLGHAVCDVDTGLEMPISNGDAVEAETKGCYKGKDGTPGELCGVFSGGVIGDLYVNGNTGIYGKLRNYDKNAEVIPVALPSEIQTGKAQILATVEAGEPKYYDVEITKVYKNSAGVRNMVIKITDEKLLSLTGGIVQGMSGTPIIQNGMLAGAVTHVFINEPTEGYAIFAENMLVTAEDVEKILKKAS